MSTRRDAATALLLATPIISTAAVTNETAVIIKKVPPADPLSEEAVRIISYTLYAEARGEPFKGKKTVAAVIATRAKILNISPAAVCLQEKQFSCWNELATVPATYSSGIGFKPIDIKARSESYGLAWLLVSGTVKWDYLTHFYNPSKASPSWKRDLEGIQMIGNHVFGYMDAKHLPRPN